MKRKFKHAVWSICLITVLATVMIMPSFAGIVSASSVPFEHPSTITNKADLEIIRNRIVNQQDPQYSAYQFLLNFIDENNILSLVPDPPAYLNTVDYTDPARSLFVKNSYSAYACALVYVLNKDNPVFAEPYAQKAVEILNAWSEKQPHFYTSNAGLHLSSHLVSMLYTADLLYDYEGWTAENRALFKQFWSIRVLPLSIQVMRGEHRYSNWGDAAGNAVITAATVFEDYALREEAINFIRNNFKARTRTDGETDKIFKFRTYVFNDVVYPVMSDDIKRSNAPTYNGLSYTGYALTSYVQSMETARSAGVNLWHFTSDYPTTPPVTVQMIIEQLFAFYYGRYEDGDTTQLVPQPVPSQFNTNGYPPQLGGEPLALYNTQGRENCYEIAQNHYPTLMQEIKDWIPQNRPIRGHQGDAFITLNKGNMPVDVVLTAAPSFYPHGGKFFGSQKVTITSLTPDAVIRYTLDGSEPTSASPEYNAETGVMITATATLKARAFKLGLGDSVVASEDYVKYNAPDATRMLGTLSGSGTAVRSGDIVDAFKYTATSSFAAVNMNIRLADESRSGNTMRMAIYDDAGGRPGTVIGLTDVFMAKPGLNTVPLLDAVSIDANSDYWFATWIVKSPIVPANDAAVNNDGWENTTFLSAASPNVRFTANAIAVTKPIGAGRPGDLRYISYDPADYRPSLNNFPSGTSFAASTDNVTYAIYATAVDEPGFYVESTLTLGYDVAIAGLSFYNSLPEGEGKATAILARYSADGTRLLDVETRTYIINAGDPASGDTFSIPFEEGEYAKLYVWDSFSQLSPLTSAKRVDNIKKNMAFAKEADGIVTVFGSSVSNTFVTVAVKNSIGTVVYLNQAFSDDDGNFEFAFPAGADGEYSVTVRVLGWGPAMTAGYTLGE